MDDVFNYAEESRVESPVDEGLHSGPSSPCSSSNESEFSVNWNEKVPDKLATALFPKEYYKAENLYIPPESINIMDARSKVWVTKDTNSDELLMQDSDGPTWAICQECVAQIPREIQNALYFFHSLSCHVRDGAQYMIPTDNIELKCDRTRAKVVTGMYWKRNERVNERIVPREDTELDMNDAMLHRSTLEHGMVVTEIKVLKLRLAFTGAQYEVDGEEQKKTFCVLFVTFARNFDALNYINNVFLKKPMATEANYAAKNETYKELDLYWRNMISFVAYLNLQLDEARVGKPENYCDNPGGVMGVDALMNVFQIGPQIRGAIKHSLRVERGVYTTIKNLRVIGLPLMKYLNDDLTKVYVRFMHIHVDCIQEYRVDFDAQLQKYMRSKTETKGADKEESEARKFALEALQPCGMWPLKTDSRDRYVKWGLPPLPIYLSFEPSFTVDAMERFRFWLVNIDGANGLPEVVKTCLRAYTVSSEGEVTNSISWDNFLTDRRPANHALVLQKYYSEKADPMSALVVPGDLLEWWFNFKRDIEMERKNGLDMVSVSNKFKRYLRSVVLNHKSMIECNAYQSDRIVQAATVIEKIVFKTVAYEGESSIKESMRRVSGKMSLTRLHSRYQIANETFWKTWELTNKSFKMNCSNLAFLVEMMVSQVFWMMGESNETWAYYFQGIHIKSCNGHLRFTSQHGVFDVIMKPNSSGMDFTHSSMVHIFQWLLNRLCMSSNKQAPVNCTGWTVASFPLNTHVTMSEGKIENIPGSEIVYNPLIATEVRDLPIGPLIMNFPRNADGLQQIKINTCDPDRTNKRKSRVQTLLQPLHIVAVSTNVNSKNTSQNEEWKTLSAVLEVMPPGSAPHSKKRKVGSFNDRSCNAFGGRQSVPENMDQIVNLFSYTNVWFSAMGALINKSGAVPFEINPAVLAFLDWMFYYIKEETEGLLDLFVAQSFNRMKEGYESRVVAKSAWTQAILDVGTSERSDAAAMKNIHALMCHAMPVCEVPSVGLNFLSRGLNLASLLVIVACAQHLNVPNIDIKDLQTFFSSPTVEGDVQMECANKIRRWLVECKAKGRFCVDDEGFRKVTCYVSSDADTNQNPLVDMICMMRVKKGRVNKDNVEEAIGLRVKDACGPELNEACHFGSEVSVYGHAVGTLLKEWKPDFRRLFGKDIYAHKKHCDKLAYTEWDCSDWEKDEPPPFARLFTIKDNTNGEISSYALGINLWALLLMVSLKATTFHPHVSADVSMMLLREILSHSPQVATPGNVCLVRSFHVESTNAQRIVIPSDDRPKHFLRPIDDKQFMETGEYSYAKQIRNFLPEDIMHCGFLFTMTKVFSCELLEIPGRLVQSEYEILADTGYPVWNPVSKARGGLIAKSLAQYVTLTDYTHEMESAWPYATWLDQLQNSDFIILPLVMRAGACVLMDGGAVGLIVPHNGKDNFNLETGKYRLIMNANETITSTDLYEMDAVSVVQKLISIGQDLFIDVTDPYFVSIQGSVPPRSVDTKLLLVKLNIPDCAQPPLDKVFVSYSVSESRVGASSSRMRYHTILVDPWMLMSSAGNDDYLLNLVL